MKSLQFDAVAFLDFMQWVKENPKIAVRIADLIRDILRDPFNGIGKPEPLKHNWQGY